MLRYLAAVVWPERKYRTAIYTKIKMNDTLAKDTLHGHIGHRNIATRRQNKVFVFEKNIDCFLRTSFSYKG